MRVALVGPTYPYRGGIAHYTTMLNQALCDRGHDVLLMSFSRQYPAWLYPGQSDKDPSEQPLQAERVSYSLDSLNPLTWLASFRLLRHFRADAVILSWWTPFWAPAWLVLGMLIRWRLHRPLLFLCHNVLPHEPKFWDRGVAKAVLRQGSSFIVQSEEEQQRLLAMLPEARVSVVPHPIYDMFAANSVSPAEARAELDIPPGAPVLLFFGIIREYKGLMDLLGAMPHIKGHMPDVRLIVAGEFWESKLPYLQAVESLGLAESVRFDDHYILNEKVPLYFRAADLVVAPHRRATGSGVVQMAIGLNVPLLTTLRLPVDEQQTSSRYLVVPPKDSQAIAGAVCDFFGRPVGAAEHQAAEDLREAFSWERLVSTVEQLGAPGVSHRESRACI
jgi:glycosyltransferase involved in cell wall biosynthesis